MTAAAPAVTVLDLDTARRLARELVDEFGADHVYYKRGSVCTYERDGAPSCIVGHILHRLGVPAEKLEDLDNAQWGASIGMLTDPVSPDVPELEALVGVQVPSGVTQGFLVVLQAAQDNGASWGSALQQAELLTLSTVGPS